MKTITIVLCCVCLWAIALPVHAVMEDNETGAAAHMTAKTQDTDGLLFLSYMLGSNEGTLVVDGRITYDDGLGLPFSRELLPALDGGKGTPLTGWVQDDGKHLYVTLDVSMATKQPSLGTATVTIKQPNGLREYRLHDESTDFGTSGFFETNDGKRLHRVFEFKIPLAGLETAKGTLELAFHAKATSRPL